MIRSRTITPLACTVGVACLQLAVATTCWAQSLALQGPDGAKAEVSAAELAALPHVSVLLNGHAPATYEGVPLTVLLARVGAPAGDAIRGPALRLILVATGADGYAATLSLAETDPAFRHEPVIVADRRSDGPLHADEGPFRLVVGGDLRPARSVRMVSRIEVLRIEP